MPNSLNLIVILLVVLALVVIGFALLERYFKQSASPKKTEEEKSTSDEAVEKPITIEPQVPPVMKIYNSELADDLSEMIKQSNPSESSRLQIENHIKKQSNISKYIQDKNYQSFDFTEDYAAVSDEEQPKSSFTSEDYKRIMALSNINDKKQL